MRSVAALALTLLGGFEVRTATGAVVTPSRKKAQALLAYLARRPGQAHARDHLSALLWGDVEDAQARASLRQALFALRSSLPRTNPAVLVFDGGMVAVNAKAVAVDVSTFEQRVTEGSSEALQQAMALYRGDLLEGFVVDAAPFEEWLVAERERLREVAIEALATLLGRQVKAGTVEPAIHTAVRLLALDPLQEVVHRELMQLYAKQGRVGTAMRQYQVCVQILQRELGAEPEAETKQAYQRILQRRSADARDTAVVTLQRRPARVHEHRPPVAPAAQLVGREPELGRLRQLLEAAWRGQPKVVAILGEAGIGKSRLVEELAADVERLGGHHLIGRAYATVQILPFGPWIEAMRSSPLTRDAEFLHSLNPVWRAELARLFPELGEPGLEMSTTPENALRLFEAVVNLVQRLASRQPLVLTLENLHCADELSLRLLAFLARRMESDALLLVGTIQAEELAEVPVLSQLLRELDAEARLVLVPLGPLSKLETACLVRTLTPVRGAPSTLAELEEQVWARSQGNPLVAVETLRACSHGGASPPGMPLELPYRVRDLIAFRLDRLSVVARQLAEIAAVIGCEFEFDLLRSAAGISERETAEGVEELVRRRILQGAGERFDFVHDRTREVTYERLLPSRRRSLHAAVAQSLERLHAADLAAIYDRLAHHHSRAENAAKAIVYLVSSSEVATERHALRESLETLERALVFVEQLPQEGRDRRRLSLVFRQAVVLHYLGQYPGMRDLLLAERERVERLGDPALSGTYFSFLSFAHCQTGEGDLSTATAHRALHEAKRSGDREATALAHVALAIEAYWSGRPRHGVEHGREALALLEKQPPSPLHQQWLVGVYWALGANHSVIGELEPALEMLGRAEAVAEAIGSVQSQAAAAGFIGILRAQRGEREAAIEACERNLARMSAAWDPGAVVPLDRALATAFLGYACTERDAPRAVGLFEQARDLIGDVPLPRIRVLFAIGLSEAYRLCGRTEEARDLAVQTLALAREAKYEHAVGCARRTLGLITLGQGGVMEAATHLEAALSTFGEIGAKYDVGLTRLALARLAHAIENREGAILNIQEALRLFETLGFARRVDDTREAAAELDITA